MATKIVNFPFKYGETLLYDELKFRAYRQKIFRYHRIGQGLEKFTDNEIKSNGGQEPDPALLAYKTSLKMKKALEDANTKRPAFFTHESIHKHFGLKGQFKNYGFFGRLISKLLSN